MPAELPEPGGIPPGLSWSWEMDFETLLAALSDGSPTPGPSAPAGDNGPASEDALLAALDQGAPPLPAGAIAVRVAERLPPGPDLVAWLATAAPAGDLPDYDVPGAAHAWRRVVAYAQAQELAQVAQMASSAAQRDKNIEVSADGRPARVPAAAVAEVSLALTMTPYSAAVWTDLAVDMKWRLRATGTALAGGLIDLPQAKLIAEATGH